MNYATACKLLIKQTIKTEDNSEAILRRMHQGQPPVPGQITSILLALKVVEENLKDAKSIDKDLASALFLITVKTQQLFTAGLKSGVDWPPLLKEDLLRIGQACESIFSRI